jgi:hypothetical protein
MKSPSNVVPISGATGASRTKATGKGTTASRTKIKPSAPTPPSGEDPWRTSVESRLGDLRSDVRHLLIAGGVVALALAGTGWAVYNNVNEKLSSAAVAQQQVLGKLDTMDARLSGQIQLVGQKVDDKPQASLPVEPAKPVR